jgi:hypothetical protein
MAWDNPNDYEYLKGKGVGLDQWAWEFIRRNPHYIEDWNTALDIHEEYLRNPEHIYNQNAFQEEKPNHIPNLWDRRDGDFAVYPTYENNPWYLINYYPPSKSLPKNLRFRSVKPFRWFQAKDKSQPVKVWLNPFEMMVTIDTRLPWRPNIASIQEELVQQYDLHIKGGHAIESTTLKLEDKNGWIECLRLWDALAAEVSKKKIAASLFPELFSNISNNRKTGPSKRVSYIKKKAQKWVEADYIKLIHKHQFIDNSRS